RRVKFWRIRPRTLGATDKRGPIPEIKHAPIYTPVRGSPVILVYIRAIKKSTDRMPLKERNFSDQLPCHSVPKHEIGRADSSSEPEIAQNDAAGNGDIQRLCLTEPGDCHRNIGG